MEKAALKCLSCDELIDCASQIEALGNVVAALAAHESEHLTWSGEALGGILCDLAEKIKSDLKVLYGPIQNIYNDSNNPFIAGLNGKSELRKLIDSELTALYVPTQNTYSGSDNPLLAELNRMMELIREEVFSPEGTLDHIKDSTKKIDQFIDKDVSPILRLRLEFEKIEESIANQLRTGQEPKGALAKEA